jgi:hypothetical protein
VNGSGQLLTTIGVHVPDAEMGQYVAFVAPVDLSLGTWLTWP